MNQIELGATILFSIVTVYYLIRPFLDNDSSVGMQDRGDRSSDRRRASILVQELEELNELKSSGNISDEDFLKQKELILKDAEPVVK